MRGANGFRTGRARRLRRDQTDVERKLWTHLNNRQLAGAKFVRQYPIGRYFADFACRESKLIVELDGSQHAESRYDEVRDAFLVSQGYRVLRFWNGEVTENLMSVLDTIYAALEERASSPRKRGEDESARADRGEGASTEETLSEAPPHPPSAGAPPPLGTTSPRRRGEGSISAGVLRQIAGIRGTLEADAPLKSFTWFRTGGPAELLFTPADEADLATFLAACPAGVPVTVIGLGSNLLVRDGGVPGVVIRLGKAFADVIVEPGQRIRAGAGAPDVKVARAAAEAGIDGLTFLRGIPGAIGGALAMNGGAYGGEVVDVLVEARALDRTGQVRVLTRGEMGFSYRTCAAAEGLIFTEALFEGRPGEPAAILAAMNAITEARQASQPVNTRTGGSTFRNPPGEKAWQLVDRAGCRGLRIGDAGVSELHTNFLVNHGAASAADIEALGEEVRRRVREMSGIELHWEIKRIGVASEGSTA